MQYVYVNLSGYNSDSLVKCRVLQGSVLGLLLFLVYVNNLPNAFSLNIRMFANDTKYRSGFVRTNFL